MDVVVFDSEELPVVLGALRALVVTPTARQKRFLEIVSRLHGEPVHADRVWPAPLTLVATSISRARQRKRLVQLAIVMSMTGERVERDVARAVERLATALAVDEPAVPALRLLADGRRLATRARVLGRALGTRVVDTVDGYRDAGLRGLARSIRRQRVLARRFDALAHYPANSLGRALWNHCDTRGIELRDEQALRHELGHVLSGYETDVAGKLQQGAFEAGYVRKDGFARLFAALLQYHFGLRLSPLTAAAVGRFDLERVMTALVRGAACKVDLSDESWNVWEAAALPLASVRETLGIRALSHRQLHAARAS